MRNVRKIGHTSQDSLSELLLLCFPSLSCSFFPPHLLYNSLSQFKFHLLHLSRRLLPVMRGTTCLSLHLVAFMNSLLLAFFSKLIWIWEVARRSLARPTVREPTVPTVLCL